MFHLKLHQWTCVRTFILIHRLIHPACVVYSTCRASSTCITVGKKVSLKKVQVSLDKPDALVAKNPSGLSRIQVKEGYFSRISRIRRPKIVQVIEGPTYGSPTYRGTPVHTFGVTS